MGDLNSKVGESNEGYEHVVGSHGLGEKNDNGERLIEFCTLNNLVEPGKKIHKAAWTSPGGRTKNQIDHVMVSRHRGLQ